MTIIITGGFTATDDTVDELRAEAVAHSQRSRGEDGCVSHHVHSDCEQPLRLVFYEVWRDMAAVQAHFRVPESGGFVRLLRAKAAAVEEIAVWEASTVSP